MLLRLRPEAFLPQTPSLGTSTQRRELGGDLRRWNKATRTGSHVYQVRMTHTHHPTGARSPHVTVSASATGPSSSMPSTLAPVGPALLPHSEISLKSVLRRGGRVLSSNASYAVGSSSPPSSSSMAGDDSFLVLFRRMMAKDGQTTTATSGTTASVRAPSSPPPSQPAWLTPAAIVVAAMAVLAGGFALLRKLTQKEENTVDALAKRGFISSDRSVPLQVIQDFDDPTSVRDYQLGNARLVEIEPLSPLTEEKMRYHRELRRREHGWKKPELVIVEGDPLPEGVDPKAVRVIPRKHPFALNRSEAQEDWSEEVVRRRLRQRRGRPEKEQERSRQQLERLRREMAEKERQAEEWEKQEREGGTGQDGGRQRARLDMGKGVLPDMED